MESRRPSGSGERPAVKLVARIDGLNVEVEVQRQGSGYRVRVGDRWLNADLVDAGPYVRSLRLEDGTQFAFTHHQEGAVHEINLSDATIRVELIDPLSLKRKRRDDEMSGGGVVRALMPGRIVRLLVDRGENVKRGAALVILEAMKMENEIHAPADGVVDAIFVETGQTVEGGADLLHIAPPV
jgi:3-methylcrotonyl-CoA carboxylase alpha subunit